MRRINVASGRPLEKVKGAHAGIEWIESPIDG
jgi:hypothetical protein